MAEAVATIQITLYDAQDEVKGTFTRSKLPWGILKKVIRMQDRIETPDTLSVEDIDAIGGLVVEIFGDQFTIEDLDAGADLGEMIDVLRAVIARASILVKTNPTVQLPTTRKKK